MVNCHDYILFIDHFRQSYYRNCHGFSVTKVNQRPRISETLYGRNHHCCQCGWSLVADWRCCYHDAVDWLTNYTHQPHESAFNSKPDLFNNSINLLNVQTKKFGESSQ